MNQEWTEVSVTTVNSSAVQWETSSFKVTNPTSIPSSLHFHVKITKEEFLETLELMNPKWLIISKTTVQLTAIHNHLNPLNLPYQLCFALLQSAAAFFLY